MFFGKRQFLHKFDSNGDLNFDDAELVDLFDMLDEMPGAEADKELQVLGGDFGEAQWWITLAFGAAGVFVISLLYFEAFQTARVMNHFVSRVGQSLRMRDERCGHTILY